MINTSCGYMFALSFFSVPLPLGPLTNGPKRIVASTKHSGENSSIFFIQVNYTLFLYKNIRGSHQL